MICLGHSYEISTVNEEFYEVSHYLNLQKKYFTHAEANIV